MVDDIIIGSARIAGWELQFRFSRSGGPGGQNVNKLETRVELLFDVVNSPGLSDSQKKRVMAALKNRIGSDGVLRVVAGESRSQFANRMAAVERFIGMVTKALEKKKKRVKTRASRASREKRIEGKKRRGKVKQLRGRVNPRDS
jgi:ribosome-associated protein